MDSYKRRFDANKVKILKNGKFPYIVRMGSNNGQRGFINEDEAFLNEGNTIAFGQDTATMFYQEVPYFTGDKIKILKAKDKRFNKNNAQFFISTMKNSFSTFSWGASSFSIDTIKKQKLSLPLSSNNDIDFNFIESLISALEAEHITKLDKYLLANGFKDNSLTSEELKALKDFEKLKWKNLSIVDVFEVKNTRNILSRNIIENSGDTPYLCASAENNAVSSYITFEKNYLDKGNCIFIGGKTFVVSYQEKDFYSNDSHNMVLYLKDKLNRNKLNQLYLATCIYKSLNHKYSWGDSISNKKIQNDMISLPIKNGIPDFEFMKSFISAIQKLIIKDLVLYIEKKKKNND